MSDRQTGWNLLDAMRGLKPKAKAPNSARVLNDWISQAERQIGSDGGRLGWLIASSVVTAALQQVVDAQGEPLFLLKGGTMLQYRLPQLTRPTTDLDGLVRGNIEEFVDKLDEVLQRPWGPFTLRRDTVTVIQVPTRVINPLRFDVVVQVKGATWRRVKVEISPDEGHAGEVGEQLEPPPLDGFGLPNPELLVGLAMAYQIAQKAHAASDPHEPPDSINDRARDVVDLILIKNLVTETGRPTSDEIHEAVLDIFSARAKDAVALGIQPRNWPSPIVALPSWQASYQDAADKVDLKLSLDEAVNVVNEWLREPSA